MQETTVAYVYYLVQEHLSEGRYDEYTEWVETHGVFYSAADAASAIIHASANGARNCFVTKQLTEDLQPAVSSMEWVLTWKPYTPQPRSGGGRRD